MDIEEVQGEARKTFDMRARLAGASRRTKVISVYTDDTAGEVLGSVEDEKIGEYKTGRKIRTGLIGELDEIKERATQAIGLLDEEAEDYAERTNEINEQLTTEAAEVVEKITELREQMRKSSMTFTLQALPDIIVRDMRRKSKAALDIKGKNIPEDREDEYLLEYTAQMLSASTQQFVDHESGDTFSELSVEQAHNLRDFLPPGQFPRLDRAMVELSIEVAISNQATDSPDFSPGI